MEAIQILSTRYPTELADKLVEYYCEIDRNYRIERWKPSELDAGHFVEVARRLIEHELFGSYTPLSNNLGSFNPSVLQKYESASGDESHRILLPRVLYSMYCVRNKRGVGHVGAISPNKMDASVILSSAKWVLSEFIRLAGQGCPDKALLTIGELADKQVDIIWSDGDTFMILDSKMKARDKILVTLYKLGDTPIARLQECVDYKHTTNFRRILKELEGKKLVHCSKDNVCRLSPLGVRDTEDRIIR